MRTSIVCGVMFLLFIGTQAKILPDYILRKPCPKEQPELNRCIVAAFENARPHLSKGIPEIGLQPFEPINIPHFSAKRTIENLAEIKITLDNVTMYGFGKTIIKEFDFDATNLTGHLNIIIPFIQTKMEFNVDHRLLNVRFDLGGLFESNTTKSALNFTVALQKIKRTSSNEFYRVKDMKVKSNFATSRVHLEPRSGRSRTLIHFIQEFYNRDPKIIYNLVSPIYTGSIAEYFTTLVNEIFSKVPVKELIAE